MDDWVDDEVGLLIIEDEKVNVFKSGKVIKSLSSYESLPKLRKKCLTKLIKLLNISNYLSKKEIENKLRDKFIEEDLKIIAKKIVLCSKKCDENCILEPFLIEASNKIRKKA